MLYYVQEMTFRDELAMSVDYPAHQMRVKLKDDQRHPWEGLP